MAPKRRSLKLLTKGRRRKILKPSSDAQRLQAGVDLLKALLSLYGLAKLSATDLCILCYHLARSGVKGGDFARYAYPPDVPSGRYQEHLD